MEGFDLTIDLEEVAPHGEGGKERSRSNQGYRRPTLLFENRQKPVVVKSKLLRAVHGTLDESGSPATLLQFLFSFEGPQSRRVKSASITVTFEDYPESGEADPVVHKVSAEGETWALNPREETSDVAHEFNTSVGGGFSGATGEVGYRYSLAKKLTQKHSATLEGGTSCFKNTGDETSATWDMKEDPEAKEGVPRQLQVAVVVCHEMTDNFRFVVDIDTVHKDFFFHGKNESRMLKPREIESATLHNGTDTENLGDKDLDSEEYLVIRTTRAVNTQR